MPMLTLKIISPEREVLSEKVDLVELPGSQGRFEVLRDHAPLVSSLDEGVIRYVIGNQSHEIPSQAGFVEVRNNVVTVCIG
ncbi:MAG: ATP synthase F1 subunit epsilon [Bacteroidales bacterium]|nr:ATP synthase F1 subunit epsilon [Bacteroidales bacterium]MBQ2598465.1 ATP synthase F1 subunit epsilon [Bacteroidales bacterium]MBQ4013210.1 ATP synthase F1 subunit epsilon [Bacteroidales bacterium]